MAYKIPKEQINSGKFIPPTPSSHPFYYAKPSRPYIVEIGGKPYAVDRTVYRMYTQPLSEFEKHGHMTQMDDRDIKSWIAGSPPPAENKYVELPKQTSALGITETFRERDLRLKHPSDTQVRLYVHDVYVTEGYWNNRIGNGVSKIENTRQRLTNYFGTDIAQALAQKAAKSWKKLEDITYIGVGFLPKNAIAAVARTKDGKVMYIDSEGVYRKICEQARVLSEFFGIYIDPETLWETVVAEEHEHINRGSLDKKEIRTISGLIKEEKATKDSVYQSFSELEKGAQGGDLKLKYRKLRERYMIQAEIKKLDRDTTDKRYKKMPGPYQRIYLDNQETPEESSTGRQEASSLEQRVSQEHSARPSLRSIKGGKHRQGGDNSSYQETNKSEYKSMSDAKAARKAGKEHYKEKEANREAQDQEAQKAGDEGGDAQASEASESSMPQAA